MVMLEPLNGDRVRLKCGESDGEFMMIYDSDDFSLRKADLDKGFGMTGACCC
jgi:hypothetical protein